MPLELGLRSLLGGLEMNHALTELLIRSGVYIGTKLAVTSVEIFQRVVKGESFRRSFRICVTKTLGAVKKDIIKGEVTISNHNDIPIRPKTVSWKSEIKKEMFGLLAERSAKERAKLLLEVMEKSKVTYDSSRFLVMDDKTVKPSNIVDIFIFIFDTRQKRTPKGLKTFYKAMEAKNIPEIYGWKREIKETKKIITGKDIKSNILHYVLVSIKGTMKTPQDIKQIFSFLRVKIETPKKVKTKHPGCETFLIRCNFKTKKLLLNSKVWPSDVTVLPYTLKSISLENDKRIKLKSMARRKEHL